jgi:hypothetical protein
MDEIKTPSQTEILLDGEKVGEFIVRPWTITKCATLSPVLERISEDFKKRKLSFRDFYASKKIEGSDKTEFEILNSDKLFFVIMPYTPEVLKISLGIDDETLEGINPEIAITIVLVILKQNIDFIKNWFALIVMAAKAIKMGASD